MLFAHIQINVLYVWLMSTCRQSRSSCEHIHLLLAAFRECDTPPSDTVCRNVSLLPWRASDGIRAIWRWKYQANLCWTWSTGGRPATTVHSASICLVLFISNKWLHHFHRWTHESSQSWTKGCREPLLSPGGYLRPCLSVWGCWGGKTGWVSFAIPTPRTSHRLAHLAWLRVDCSIVHLALEKMLKVGTSLLVIA